VPQDIAGGRTALHMAACANDKEMLSTLVGAANNPSAVVAAASAMPQQRMRMENGKQVPVFNDYMSTSPLQAAAYLGCKVRDWLLICSKCSCTLFQSAVSNVQRLRIKGGRTGANVDQC
jgi:hypothetical protein